MKKKVEILTPSNKKAKMAISSASKFLHAIGNERRLQIVCYLLDRERQVGELEDLIGISQSALSQHLAPAHFFHELLEPQQTHR